MAASCLSALGGPSHEEAYGMLAAMDMVVVVAEHEHHRSRESGERANIPCYSPV